MKKTSTLLRDLFTFPLYPWLLVTYLIVFLYSQNIAIVKGIEVIYVLVAAWVIVGISLGIVFLGTWNLYKSAAIVAVISVVFLVHGHVLNIVPEGTRQETVYLIVGVPALLLILVIWWLQGAGKITARLVTPVNMTLTFLLILPLLQITQYQINQMNRVVIPPPTASAAPKIKNSADRPDIYYIILDGYSSNAHLLRDYGYDNSDFTDALEERGFFVAYDSAANYAATLASLPSALNMRYFDEDDTKNEGALGVAHTRDLLSNNRVASDLRDMGYTYINMMSGYTAASPIADENIDFYAGGMESYRLSDEGSVPDCAPACFQQSFIRFFLDSTIVRAFTSTILPPEPRKAYTWEDPQRYLAMWEYAPSIAEREEATFAFVHIIKPHIPVIFSEEGEIREPDSSPEAYFEQLRFVNKQTLAMLDQILEKSSVPPLIILQADHGTHLGNVWDPTERYLAYFEILNAFYWPGAPEGIIPNDITSVNTFRLMFNTYFGTDYELLENHHYIVGGYNNLFNMVEVDLQDIIENGPQPRSEQ